MFKYKPEEEPINWLTPKTEPCNINKKVFRNAKRLFDCAPPAAAAPDPFAAVLPPPAAPLPLPRLLLPLRAPIQARQGNDHLSPTLVKEAKIVKQLLPKGYFWLSDL